MSFQNKVKEKNWELNTYEFEIGDLKKIVKDKKIE